MKQMCAQITNKNKMALLISIEYVNTAIQLSDSTDDLCMMINYLKHIGFVDEDIIILSDNGNFVNAIKPTYANIIYYINELANYNISFNDAYIVLCYNGHGIKHKICQNGKYFIANCIIPTDTDNVISNQLLKEILTNKIQQTTTMFCFVDCCYGSGLFDVKYKLHNDKCVIINNDDKSEGKIFIIASSNVNETTAKTPNDTTSLFTHLFYKKFKINTNILSLIKQIQAEIANIYKLSMNIQFFSNVIFDDTMTIPNMK
jgi:hypothetical protein